MAQRSSGITSILSPHRSSISTSVRADKSSKNPGYDVATGTWSTEGAYDAQDYAETEQL